MCLNRISTFFASLILLIILATGSDGGAEAPAIAERPNRTGMLTISQLDKLLRHADVLVDVHQSMDQRRKAAVKLIDTRSRYARPAFLTVLHRPETDSTLRYYAAWGLGEIDDPCVVDDLIDLLSDEDYKVATAAEKRLQEITKREGQQGPLPRDAGGPARAEVQEAWRLWWKKNEHRFVSRQYHLLRDLDEKERNAKPRIKPITSPVLADYVRERLNFEDKWVYVRDGEVTWSHDRIRWIPLFANPPGVKRTRWLCKPFDDLNDESVPWKEFTSAPGGRPAEGRAGVGSWAIAPEVEMEDGRKLFFRGYPDW